MLELSCLKGDDISMNERVISKFKKALIIVLSLIILVSVGFNIHQYTEAQSNVQKAYSYAKLSMNNHEAAFINAFSAGVNKPILKYIKTPENLSNFIENIQISEFFYHEATDYVRDDKLSNRRAGLSEQLIDLYLSDLKSYRISLENNSAKLYSGNIKSTIGDLQTIRDWLNERSKKKDFTVYTDDDFYNSVYKKLKSDIKKASFFNE